MKMLQLQHFLFAKCSKGVFSFHFFHFFASYFIETWLHSVVSHCCDIPHCVPNKGGRRMSSGSGLSLLCYWHLCSMSVIFCLAEEEKNRTELFFVVIFLRTTTRTNTPRLSASLSPPPACPSVLPQINRLSIAQRGPSIMSSSNMRCTSKKIWIFFFFLLKSKNSIWKAGRGQHFQEHSHVKTTIWSIFPYIESLHAQVIECQLMTSKNWKVSFRVAQSWAAEPLLMSFLSTRESTQ